MGCSGEATVKALSSVDSADALKPLIDDIVSGYIHGVCLFAGCNSFNITQNANYTAVIRKG